MSRISKQRREHLRKRHYRVRKKVVGTAERPRLAVSRSLRNISCQLIDDDRGHTLAAASSLNLRQGGGLDSKAAGSMVGAEKVGEEIARLAKEAGVEAVTFDRGGYRYHGRVRALADAARKGGLRF